MADARDVEKMVYVYGALNVQKVEAHSLSESQLEWLRERRAKKEEERKHMEAHNAERKTGGPREQKNE